MFKLGFLEIYNANVVYISNTELPNKKSQQILFLGMCNVYQLFIGYFIRIAHPQKTFLKKETLGAFELEDEQKAAFHNLIDMFVHHRSWN